MTLQGRETANSTGCLTASATAAELLGLGGRGRGIFEPGDAVGEGRNGVLQVGEGRMIGDADDLLR